MSVFLYWIVNSFYLVDVGSYYIYAGAAQSIAFISSIILYFSVKSFRARSCLLVMCLYQLYSHMADIIAPELPVHYYMAEVALFSLWAFWVAIRPNLNIPLSYNTDNILLAFYRGESGSPLMDIFSLFGVPVKSMCIVAGDSTLMLRSNKENFQFCNNSASILNNKDYIILDTGKKWDVDFKVKMSKCARKSSRKYGLRICCVASVSDLLSEIDNSWKAEKIYDNIPSIYLYKALNK